MKAIDDTFSVEQMKKIEEIMRLDKELVGLYKQLNQYQVAIKELEAIEQDIKNKKITKIFMPSLGNMMIQVNPTNNRYKKWIEERKREFNNSIKGIEGQILHRLGYFNEDIMFMFRAFGKFLQRHDFDLPLSYFDKKVE